MANVYQTLMLERVAAGLIPGASIVRLRGEQSALTTSYVTVWQQSAAVVPYLTTATAMEVLSGSASDTAAGTGAQTVTITGVDGSYNVKSETIALNGVSAVQSTNTYLAINSFKVASVGSGLVQAGSLTCRVTGAGAVQSTIKTGFPGQALDYIYTIPAGYIGLIYDLNASQTVGTGVTTVGLVTFTPAGGTVWEYLLKFNNTSAGPGYNNVKFPAPILIPEKTSFQAQAVVSAGVGDVSVFSKMLLINRTGVSGLYSGSNCLGF